MWTGIFRNSSMADGVKSEQIAQKDDDVGGISFYPPLYQKRYAAAVDFLKQRNAKKVVDFGCAECKLLLMVRRIPTVEDIIGVDIDQPLLATRRLLLKPLICDYLAPRERPLRIRLFEGSLSEYDSRLDGVDVVTMIEVIEHLVPEVLAAFPTVLFGRLRPPAVFITTPNAEFNVLFKDFTGMRHDDHKFEWTRAEFREWCAGVCSAYSYNVEYGGVGEPPADRQEVGHCSQFAIFTRRDPNSTSTDPVSCAPGTIPDTAQNKLDTGDRIPTIDMNTVQCVTTTETGPCAFITDSNITLHAPSTGSETIPCVHTTDSGTIAVMLTSDSDAIPGTATSEAETIQHASTRDTETTPRVPTTGTETVPCAPITIQHTPYNLVYELDNFPYRAQVGGDAAIILEANYHIHKIVCSQADNYDYDAYNEDEPEGEHRIPLKDLLEYHSVKNLCTDIDKFRSVLKEAGYNISEDGEDVIVVEDEDDGSTVNALGCDYGSTGNDSEREDNNSSGGDVAGYGDTADQLPTDERWSDGEDDQCTTAQVIPYFEMWRDVEDTDLTGSLAVAPRIDPNVDPETGYDDPDMLWVPAVLHTPAVPRLSQDLEALRAAAFPSPAEINTRLLHGVRPGVKTQPCMLNPDILIEAGQFEDIESDDEVEQNATDLNHLVEKSPLCSGIEGVAII